MTVDLQRASPALGICCDCNGPVAIDKNGRCETCGSASIIQPHSLATTLAREQLVLDPKFMRGARWTE